MSTLDHIAHDIERLIAITKEALHPTTPTPGHPDYCVCHRCRTFEQDYSNHKAM